MSNKKPFYTTKVTLIFGFGIILSLVLVAAIIGHYLVDAVVRSQDQIVHIHNVKKDLSRKMLAFAQQRFLSASRMIHSDDIFVIEDLKMERIESGGNFIYNLEHLLKMPLTQIEKEQLKKIRARASNSSHKVDDIIVLVEQGKLELAIKAFGEQGISSQKAVYDALSEFAELQENYVEKALENTRIKKRQYQITQIFITGFLVLIGLALAAYVIRRITATERQLAWERKQALTTLGNISDTVISMDEHHIIEYINPAGKRLLHCEAQDVIGKPIHTLLTVYNEAGEIVSIEDSSSHLSDKKSILNGKTNLVLHGVDNTQFLIEIEISDMHHDLTEELLGHVVAIKDVTQERKAAKTLEYQANTDLLTGLANRANFENKLQHIVNTKIDGQSHVICFMDLDRFKIVNDTCGHQAGDELLKQIGHLLKNKTRKVDLLARFGGDEFALLLQNCDSSTGIHIAKTLIDAIAEFRFVWDDNLFTIGLSIGIASFSQQRGCNVKSVIKAADTACYRAKDMGRNTYYVYNPEDSAIAQRTSEMNWSNRILNALEQDRIVLFGQKIVPLPSCTEQYEYFIEVLMRYNDRGKLVAPNAFIPAAERYHLMAEVDKYIINKVFANIQSWPSDLLEKIKISINLSGQTIGDARTRDFILEKIKEYNIGPGIICFEITETSAIANLLEAAQFIKVLKAVGCTFALDDFGSGLSSFAYLQSLPIDYLKIDGSLVRQISNNTMQRHMVESIHKIGEMMGIGTVAEYVEDQAILDALNSMGVHYGQGYHLAKPQPINELIELSQVNIGKSVVNLG